MLKTAEHRLISIILLIFLAGILCGCGIRTGGRTGGSTSVTMTDPSGATWSRQVTYSLESSSTTATSGVPRQDAVTITFDGGRLVVERARLLLNDKEVAQVPESAKTVNIDYSAGKLTITADGSKAYEGKLPK